jgi:hypothetical protein
MLNKKDSHEFTNYFFQIFAGIFVDKLHGLKGYNLCNLFNLWQINKHTDLKKIIREFVANKTKKSARSKSSAFKF